MEGKRVKRVRGVLRKDYPKLWREENPDKVRANRLKYSRSESCRVYNAKWNMENIESWKKIQKNSRLKRKYGITLDKYNKMFKIKKDVV